MPDLSTPDCRMPNPMMQQNKQDAFEQTSVHLEQETIKNCSMWDHLHLQCFNVTLLVTLLMAVKVMVALVTPCDFFGMIFCWPMCFLFVDAGKSGRMYTGITKCFQFEEGAADAQTGPCWGLKHLLSFVGVFVWFACAYSFVVCHTEKKHVAHPCMFDRYRANIGGFLTWCTPISFNHRPF